MGYLDYCLLNLHNSTHFLILFEVFSCLGKLNSPSSHNPSFLQPCCTKKIDIINTINFNIFFILKSSKLKNKSWIAV